MTITVSDLWIHPVKGCRALPVDTLPIDELGAVGDRRFLIVDANEQMLTQRTHPQLATILPELDSSTLKLTSPGHGSVRVSRESDSSAPRVTTTIWNDHGLTAEACGEEAAAWVSGVLGEPARLLRIGSDFQRVVKRAPEHRVNFADAYPLLVISEASLTMLNERLIAQQLPPVPMDRFRPNIVVRGCAAHAEDEWTRFRIGDVILRGMTRCSRCLVPTTDQLTGLRTGPEPLRTLATYRRDPEHRQDVMFGRNVLNESKSGRIRRGDLVAPICGN